MRLDYDKRLQNLSTRRFDNELNESVLSKSFSNYNIPKNIKYLMESMSKIDNKYNELETSLVYFSGFDIDEDDIKNEIDIFDIKQRLSSDYTSEKFNDFAFEKDDDNFSLRLEKDDIESLFER